MQRASDVSHGGLAGRGVEAVFIVEVCMYSRSGARVATYMRQGMRRRRGGSLSERYIGAAAKALLQYIVHKMLTLCVAVLRTKRLGNMWCLSTGILLDLMIF